MKFGYAILYVDDVEATLEFYERAFGLPRRMLDDEKRYGELESGGTRLAFAANNFVRQLIPVEIALSGPGHPAPPFELGFVAEDVESAFARALASGAVAVKPPETKPWGQIVGYVRDVNGFLVEICSEIP
jgi:lactoylglutathione lyase